MKISFNVLCYNRDDIIAQNIEALKAIKLSLMDFGVLSEINVIDNNSTDNSKSIILELEEYIDNICFNKENLGVAGGRNAGLKIATGDWIFVIDDDSVLTIEAVVDFLKFIEIESPKRIRPIGIFGLNVINMASRKYLEPNTAARYKISNFHGAAHIISSELIKTVGYFDELCDFGGEELDYSIRCIDNGFDLVFLANIEVRHFCKVRVGVEQLSRRQKWIKNYIRVMFKHFYYRHAVMFSLRYFISSFVNAVYNVGLVQALKIMPYYVKGVRLGMKNRKKVKISTMEYYLNKRLVPEFGNRPILSKLLNRLKK
ncbi:glycosyltransferase [Vibrio fluvialis]|uniref:glycosyltransferase family 2 protein n=1 Tax=Vibrio fluvialis TaxID=676 RepID=UPI001F301F00|nr:glycosyltransferase [Vibrio fluvialis]MCE7639647.1 glycosyltransferase [Vibrio fluvialis]UPO64708.1 glycosyl transferase [Vibrio fluvialis]